MINWEKNGTRGMIYRENTPIGILTIIEGAVYEPHVQWLPIARKRDIYHAIKLVLTDLALQKPTIVSARKAIAPLWDVWIERGLLRRVGVLNSIPELEQIHIYQVTV